MRKTSGSHDNLNNNKYLLQPEKDYEDYCAEIRVHTEENLWMNMVIITIAFRAKEVATSARK